MTSLEYTHNSTQIIISLPEDILWENESDFTSIVQSINHSVDGIVIIEEFVKVSGLKITLSGSETRAWISKDTLDLLKALTDIPGKEITLTLSNRTFQVMLDRTSGKPVEFHQNFDVYPYTTSDWFWIKLNFITI